MRSHWLIAGTVFLTSCSRTHYRQSADRETYPVVAQHVVLPTNAIGRVDIQPAPQSRLADPFDPDRPPKPPDDVAAAGFMEHPGKFFGSRRWEKDGVVTSVETVGWETTLGIEPNGKLKLTQDKAVTIALDNSREYQTALENVYLTALSLTLNRFEFDSRWFGRNTTTYAQTGFGGPPTLTNTLDTTSDRGFTRNLAAGGQVMVDFANSFVWEYSGNTSRVSGNFTASLMQPLLRNFGRKVRLESLTQAERDTLYAVRDFARFRKQFWVATAVDSGGYLSLLLLQQSIVNAQANLKSQEENFLLGQELYKGNKKSGVEVDTIFQGLLSARQRVLDAEIGLQQALDSFKIQMGLPPRVPIELDNTYLKQFVLVAPELEKLRDEFNAFGRSRNAELGAPPSVEALKKNYGELLAISEKIPVVLDAAEADLKRWKAELARAGTVTEDAEQRERADSAFKQQSEEIVPQRAALTALQTKLKQQQGLILETSREASWKTLTRESTLLGTIVDAAISAQTLSRIYLIRLPDVDVVETEAVAQAKENRLDLQNRLAQVTDAWRKVTVAANQLQADFNLIARVNLVNDPTSDNPLDFSKDLSKYSVGLQFDSPLNRVAERNQYRLSLISYQRARRAYMQATDQVEQQIRNDIRSLRQSRISFEIARQSLITAARQLENEKLNLISPIPVAAGNNGDATLRVLRALDQLLSGREQLAGSFIRYEQQRVRLLLNLEALQLDERGFPLNVSPNIPIGPAPAVERPATK